MNGRVIALDIGERRIGIAACDPYRIVVSTLGVVKAEPRERALAQLQRIVRDEEAALVVVGLPLTLRGEHGPQAKQVLAFAEELRAIINVPVVFYDERFTSSEAERLIQEYGSKRDKHRREAVDEMAARLILEDYLHEQRIKQARMSENDEQ